MTFRTIAARACAFALGTALLSVTPARAQYVEVIVAAAKAVDEYNANKKKAAWEDSVSSKLDRLIAQNENLEKSIAALGVAIVQDLEHQSDVDKMRDAGALASRFQKYTTGYYLPGLKEMRGDVDQVAYNLSLRSPTVYQSLGATAVLSFGVDKAVKLPSATRKKGVTDMINALELWAGDTKGNFGYLITETQKVIVDSTNALPQSSNDTLIFSTPVSGISNGQSYSCTIWLRADLNVNRETLSYNLVDERQDWRPCPVRHVLDGGTVATKMMEYRDRLDAAIAGIKAHRNNLVQLKEHQANVFKIVVELKKLRATIR